MQINPRKNRIQLEISKLLAPKYGQENLEWDPDDYNWIYIKNFPLPKGWVNRRGDSSLYQRAATPLLLEIPPGYPRVAPQNFYAERQLQCGTDFISHYFDKANSHGQNKYIDKGWAWLCIHINSWDDRTNVMHGDNLLTVCKLIFDMLSDKRGARHRHY